MQLQCYCCGDLITGDIALVSMDDVAVGRVFVMKPTHASRADANVIIVTKKEPGARPGSERGQQGRL